MYLSRRDFDRHGYTDGCRGCMDLASGKQRAGSFLSPHNVACRRRMEALIKADDPDRWARWLLRRGQEEEAEVGHVPPSGDADAPSGSAGPAEVMKVSEEVKLRKSGHQEETSESDLALDAPPRGDADAPSGSADPAAVVRVSEEAKLRKSGHHEEASESDSVSEAPEEARERKPGC